MHPGRFVAHWCIDPSLGMAGADRAREALAQPWVVGLYNHVHSWDRPFDHADLYPFYALAADVDVPVTMQAGTSGGLMPSECGRPIGVDRPALYFRRVRFVLSHTGWPWVDETTAVALHKGNVYWEMSGWAPKYFPGNLKVDMRARLQDKVMFGSDYPSMPYARILKEWGELGYKDEIMEKIFHRNAERILGL